MRKFDSSKVNIEYRDNVIYAVPIEGRKYTMTHSNITGELFVTIGFKYALDKINSMRDEVLIELVKSSNKIIFYGQVLIDGEGIKGNSKIRNDIFIKEMIIALKAIRYADSNFFEEYPELDKDDIYIQFKSSDTQYNKLHHFGNMEMYKT